MTPKEVLVEACRGNVLMAEAVRGALRDAGYVVVPREPTPAMVCGFLAVYNYSKDDGSDPEFREAYRAMLAAVAREGE